MKVSCAFYCFVFDSHGLQDSEICRTSRSVSGDGDSNSLKRKRITSNDVSSSEQGSSGLPNVNNVESWPDLAASGQIDRLTKKQRKKFNRHLREQAEQQHVNIVPPVENILGWSAQFRDDATSQMSIDYGYGPPPPPLTTPPPIPMSSPPSQPSYPSSHVWEPGNSRMLSSSRQDHANAENDSKQPLPKRPSPLVSPSYNSKDVSKQESHSQPVQSSREAKPQWSPFLFFKNGRIIGSVTKDTKSHMCTFDLTGFHIHPPPVIERSLVMDSIPRKFRIPDFFYSWCREIGLSRPLAVLANPRSSKALLEFESEELAHKAYNSPRLKNTDGRSGMRLYWYTPLKQSDETSSHQVETSSKPQIALQPSKPSPRVVRDDMEEGEICEDECSDALEAPACDVGYPTSLHRNVDPSKADPKPVSAKKGVPILATLSDMDVDMDRPSESIITPEATYSTLSFNDAKRVMVSSAQESKNQSADVNEAKGQSTSAISVEPSASGMNSLDKLAQLRQRVLASKRKRPVSSETSSTPNKLDPAINASLVARFSTSSESSISIASSTSSSISVATASSSKSLSSQTLPIVSSSHLDELATDFLNNILGPQGFARNPFHVRMERKAVVEEKQRRLERHIADSKQLMSKYVAASSKAERDQIMKVIREKNRCAFAKRSCFNLDFSF